MSEPRVSVREFLRGMAGWSLDGALVPEIVWGMFEYLDAEGELQWVERVTDGADFTALLGQISAKSADLERHDSWDGVWWEDEPDIGEGKESVFDERFDRLMFRALAPEERLTGRYVLFVLGAPDEDGDRCASFQNPGVEDEELEGLLRVAQLRFMETLTWTSDDGEDEEDDERPEDEPEEDLTSGTFGELFPGWSFEPLEVDLTIDQVWALVEFEDTDGDRAWAMRRSDGLFILPVIGWLNRVISWREEEEIQAWDAQDDRPPFPAGRGPRAESAETGDEAEDAAEGPLDPRVAAIRTMLAEDGDTAVRALVSVWGHDEEGTPGYRAFEAARPGWRGPVLSGFEEIGLLRSALRELIREG